ncbi:aromatic ring-hydroxylating dioxygenase subunit alpha [Niveibacterium sp. SC-1]|uniref:aromatic ring-hydroxylating dioxygenase subunit alpha n=1 Tax=Niveibacterium sp. SC-1 TaxID=3135646 RepID=UPI00311D648F
MVSDPVMRNDWHVVATGSALTDTPLAARLLEEEIVLWRDASGTVHAWEDRCPHRGTRFSIGAVVDGQLRCRYHGWRFDASGACTLRPAHPQDTPPRSACARTWHAREAYGLIWVCLGEPAQDVPPFAEFDDPHLRTVLCGPYEVAASAPRVIENFLDQAHFAFVHEGILGAEPHTGVPPYKVMRDVEGCGVVATELFAWQPMTNSLAHGGSMVEYAYRCPRPLTSILSKQPEAQQDFHEAILLTASPVDETHVRVWIILAMTNFVQGEEELRAFQETIFLQDKPILENQVPARLPLDPRAEVPQPADLLSSQYRRWLTDIGLAYGVIRPAA